MSANTNFRITELDPNAIKQNLKNFLRSQTEFTDYDFEGSGMNILLDLLAYNTHYLGFYMNMLGAESFLDSAQLRGSIVSHAKHIGYTPRGQNPASAYVNIVVTPSETEDTAATSLTMPKWTKLIGQSIDGVNYPFTVVNSNSTIKVANTFTFSNVLIKQGQVITRAFLAESGGEKREYFISSANVDIDEIYVSVQKSTTNNYVENYTKFNDLTSLTANSQVFFIEENSMANNDYKIYFGDGFLGKKPEDGNIITVTYLDSSGKYGNGANSFLLVGNINGFDDNVRISSATAAYGGADRETIEQIRYRAPKYYTTQGRAVTEADYETLILMDYPNIQSVSVWGGETEDPPVYGKVYISLMPRENYFITNLDKTRIIDEIVSTRSVMSVIPEIVDPDYTWLLLYPKVFYELTKAAGLSETQLSSVVRAGIITFRENYMKRFDNDFRVSEIERYLEALHDSFNSVDVKLKIQKRLEPTLLATKSYTVDFKTSIEKDTLSTFPSFQAYDSGGTSRSCYIEEVPYSYTGINSITVTNRGSGYEDATVTISGDGTGATAEAVIVNKQIVGINVLTRGSNYTKGSVTITSETGASAAARLELQRDTGTLRMYYFNTNGEKVFIDDNVGTINYRTGMILIDNLRILSITENDNYDGVVTFGVEPQDFNIDVVKNSILDVDANDNRAIQITMVPE